VNGSAGSAASSRLALALAASAALHLSLIFGFSRGVINAPVHSVPARIDLSVPPLPALGNRHAPLVGVRDAEAISTPHAKPLPVQPQPQLQTVAAAQLGSKPASASSLAASAQRRDESALPPADVPLLTDPTWYEAKELDRYPAMLASIQPDYPAAAASHAVTGAVTVLLRIDETGRVREVSVVSADPPGYFEDAALQAIRAARFEPAQRDGLAVRSQVVVKLRFAPPQTL